MLLSIQSLLSATPYFNEPGYEDHNKASDKHNIELYNSKVIPRLYGPNTVHILMDDRSVMRISDLQSFSHWRKRLA